MKPSMQQIAAAFKSYLSKNPLERMLKIDKTLKVSEDGTLGVNTAKVVQENDDLPVTSNAVRERVGDIDSLKEET